MAARIRRVGWAQRLLLWLASLLWRPRRAAAEAPKRICLIRFDKRVGEVLLQTPLFAALREAHPQARLVAVTHPRMVPLLRSQPLVDEVLGFALRGWPLNPQSWRSLRSLSALRCDVAIDCSNYTLLSTSHAVAAVATRAPRRIGFARGQGFAASYNEPVTPLVDVASERRQRLHLLSAMGVEASARLPQYSPGDEVRPPVAEMLEELGRSEGGFVVVNPGGRLAWRRVGLELFALSAAEAVKRGRQAIVVWGPGERELAEALCQSLGSAARLAPPTNLDELARLMQAAACTITNNSGPMHLSVAVGAATLALFLDMPAARWGYDMPPHMVVDISGRDAPESLVTSVSERFFDGLLPHGA